MKFFGREKEIEILRDERKLSHRQSRFTVVTGRRRVGKTELVRRALNDGTDVCLYLLLTRQSEKGLCQSLQRAIREQLGDLLHVLGHAERVSDLIREVVRLAKDRPLTLIIDEFQEMEFVNPGFYAELQGIWDEIHLTHKLNLVVSGSVNRMMNKIMFSYSSPLYGRNTAHLRLQPFSPSLLKEIFAAHCPRYRLTDLLDLWTMTGGVARYVALLMDAGAVTRSKMLKVIFSEASPFLDEGRAVLVQEFGNDYANYFSILDSIASGHTRYNEIEQDLGTNLGSFLTNLENNYGLVKRTLPVYAARTGKNAAYHIEDCFFRFWFRYLFRNQVLVEFGRFEYLRELVARDFDTFTGPALEQYFRCKFREERDYIVMGAWWDRKGENEIDLVCESPAEKKRVSSLTFFEVKRDAARVDLDVLRAKTVVFFEKHPELKNGEPLIVGLSLADM